MITVHHLENSRSQRITWLLEELGLPYEIRHYKRDPQTLLAPPELRAVHPLGKSPVITDDGRTVAESGAIIDYLIERHGQGRLIPPAGSPERLQYTYWMHYAEGSLMPILVMTLVFSRIESGPMPFFVRPIARAIVGKVRGLFLHPQTDLHLRYLNDHLERNPWFTGAAFTAADIQMSFPIEAALTRVRDAGRYPQLVRYAAAMRERPAYQRAAAKGGTLAPLG